MDVDTYAAEAVAEATHWWFVGRRRLFAREIERLCLPRDARILDVGTSTGTNLRMLRDAGFSNVSGLDFSAEAVRYCSEKGLGDVRLGDVCDLPFADSSFDLVLATDIIEHIDDDGRALRELYRVAKPGGRVLITVPAFMALWGLQDDVSHHRRRYLQGTLQRSVAAAGFMVSRAYYFNFLLFVPIWAARQIIRLLRVRLRSENDVNTGTINAVLSRIFEMDCRAAPVLRPPFGVSILMIAERPAVVQETLAA